MVHQILWRGLLTLMLFVVLPIQAKWRVIEDAPSENTYAEEFNIHQNGTYEQLVEETRTILTEIGRDQAANIRLRYNGDSEKIEIISAKTIYQNREYPVEKQYIEDKPLASANEGFDQTRQILIAFPKTEIGAKICLKYRLTLTKPIIDNFFGQTTRIGCEELTRQHHIKIHSQLPLQLRVNDPQQALQIQQSRTNTGWNLELKLRKPIYRSIVNEPAPIIPDPQTITWVSVSNLTTWEELAARYGKLLGPIFDQELPLEFKTILQKAQAQSDEVAQINTVTSLLNDRVRYMGDWRSVNGRFVPRPLSRIEETHIGDCKDFSAVTAAILNRLGFKAQLVAVMRGLDQQPWPILPSFENFNHMMVRATTKQGKVYWIDPTNFESMAGGIFPDIADRPAMILDAQHPEYRKIPAVSSAQNHGQLTRSLTIQNQQLTEDGKFLLNNEATLGLIGAQLKVSQDTVKSSLYTALNDGQELDEKHQLGMQLPPLTSRIVQNLAITYRLLRENGVLQTNAGSALKLTYSGIVSNILSTSQDYVASHLVWRAPYRSTRTTVIKGIQAPAIAKLNQKITTRWLDIERKCSWVGQDLHIQDFLTLHRNLITAQDFKNPDFIRLKQWLKQHFQEMILVFQPTGTTKTIGR